MRRRTEPFDCDIHALGPRGVGIGTAPDGRRVEVRGAPPGSRVAVIPTGRKNGALLARRSALVTPPAASAEPRCAQFGLCGGCVLQELALPAQRAAKEALGRTEVEAHYGPLDGVVVHEVRGSDAAYGYRNKVELAFGPRRYLSEPDHLAGLSHDGRFLGFHAPGRFDRVVDAPRCELASEPMNAALAAIRALTLGGSDRPLYDPRAHTGFWRHLVLREGADGVIAVVFTTSAPDAAEAVAPLAELVGRELVGFQWRTNDDVADVARGPLQRSLGAEVAREVLGGVELRLSPTAFFQVNTGGTALLYDTVGGALGRGGTLVDLYCGVGAIGLYLAHGFERIVGIEENPDAVVDARANAARNGIAAEFHAGKVEEHLAAWAELADVHVVVDPPRAGLHPKVAKALAAGRWASLVYVACNPASLGRDAVVLRAGGWRLAELWAVDLFPQTGHVELVARFAPTRGA
jgi:23S rRNA (uracil1939-C5)-methyltransferase